MTEKIATEKDEQSRHRQAGNRVQQSQQHDHASTVAVQEKPADTSTSTGTSLSGSLLGSSLLNGRGNAPVRIAMMQQMQQTYGNRAVQRFLQRRVQAPVPVQRCGGEVHAGCPCAGEAQGADVQRAVSLQREEPKAGEAKGGKAKATGCATKILAEGTCEFLATNSKWICCDPDKGFSRPGRKTSPADTEEKCERKNGKRVCKTVKKTCESEKWSPIFTCDNKCSKALEKGCDDNDNWMAIPGTDFSRTKCGDEYTICANGKQAKGYVRDRSVTSNHYEVSPGIQKTLGVAVGSTFTGAVYGPGTDQGDIDKDTCCAAGGS